MSSEQSGGFQNFWKEVKRRKVAHVATVYAMTAWLLIQFCVAVFPYLGMPDWTVTAVIVLSFVGFPLALIISWIYELGPGGLVATADAEDEQISSGPSKKSRARGSIVIVVLAVLLVGQYFYFNHWKAGAMPAVVEGKVHRSNAVAVLPFVNMSSDPDQEYFSDGLTEDIITQLAKIKDLDVISRTTCMKYKGDSLSIKEIGSQLNVASIMEGSVQRAGDQLRITAQLIDVSTDAHIWAESYDRSVKDLFSIQTEIATAIAGMLEQTLSPKELNELAEIPTKNIEAYQAYLRGRHLSHQPHFDGEVTLRAIGDLEQAVRLDSTFALAYAELARCHARTYYLRTDKTKERLTLATKAAEKALTLAPYKAAVHLAIGDYFNWAFRDKAKAMEHWSIAEKGLPNNTDLISSRAMVMLTDGRTEESVIELEKATRLSPQDVGPFSNLAWAQMWAHRFPESIAAADKAIELAPDLNWPYLYRGLSYFCMKGPCPEARAAFKSVDQSYGWYFWAMYLLEVGEGDMDAAFVLLSELPDGWDIRKTEAVPAVLYQAFLHQHLGDTDLALKAYKEAVLLLDKELPTHPDDARYHSALGMALAGAGKKERALQVALKATELRSFAKDQAYGVNPIYDLAVTYTLVGDFDKAFEQLDFNLANPGYFTVEFLKTDVRYDALRNDPRYARLLEKHALSGGPI